MSPEDVLSRWMSKELRKRFKGSLFEQYKYSSRIGTEPTERKQRLALDAPVVCRPCNNDWMSRIDKLAKPILNPLITSPHVARTLSAEQCGILASWMTMKSIVLDRLGFAQHGQRAVSFRPFECSRFKTTHIPPSRVTVWIGRFDPERPIRGHVRAIYYDQLNLKRLSNLYAFVCTMRLDELAIQLIALRPKLSGSRIPHSIPFATYPTEGTWAERFIELWPNLPDSIAWPTPRSLGGQRALNAVANRLDGRF